MSYWVACAEAERPPDAYVKWHYDGCDKCVLKAKGQLVRFPDSQPVRNLLAIMGVDDV